MRRIFELSAAGNGFTRIAKALNAEGALAPRAQQARPSGWAPTSVKEVSERRLYLGELVWNRTRKRDKSGQHHPSARPESEWLRQSLPALRIVSEEAWMAAHDRLQAIRVQLGTTGRRRKDQDSRHLLAGFARCACCGGSFGAMSRPHGHERVFRYGCLVNYKRGLTVCDNNLQMRTSRLEDAVLETIGGKVLRPAVVNAILQGVLAEMAPKAVARTVEKMRAELQEAERAIGHLTKAIAAGGPLESLLAELKARQAERDRIVAALASHERATSRGIDRRAIEQRVKDRAAEWRSLLSTKRVEDGRQLLRECLTGPLRFTPRGRTYHFEGEAARGRLLAGEATCGRFAKMFGTSQRDWAYLTTHERRQERRARSRERWNERKTLLAR